MRLVSVQHTYLYTNIYHFRFLLIFKIFFYYASLLYLWYQASFYLWRFLDPPPKKDSVQFIISALSAVSFAAVITFGPVTNVLSPLWTDKGGTFLCLTNNDCEEDFYN